MHVHLLRESPTDVQLREMLEAQLTYIKLAVDVERGVLAGGGEYHADCEEVFVEPTLRARIEKVVRQIFTGAAA